MVQECPDKDVSHSGADQKRDRDAQSRADHTPTRPRRGLKTDKICGLAGLENNSVLVADETTVAGQIDHETRRSGLDPFVDVEQRGQQELAHHQVRGVTRTIRQSPDTNGGAHDNNEELDVGAEALGSHFCRGWVFVESGQASSSLMSKDPSTCARATMRGAGGCRGRHGGAARCGIQSSQCHVGLSLPRSQRQFGRQPHRTHGHAAVALPWVVLRGALLHGQAREAPRRTVLVPATHNSRTDPQACQSC